MSGSGWDDTDDLEWAVGATVPILIRELTARGESQPRTTTCSAPHRIALARAGESPYLITSSYDMTAYRYGGCGERASGVTAVDDPVKRCHWRHG